MMRAAVAAICLFLVTMATVASAESNASYGKLGKVNLALKLGYINFTNGYFNDTDDDGVYVGIEGYVGISDDIYIGMEVGRATNITEFDDEIDFLPVELNAKYVNELGTNFFLALGGGLSFNRANIEIERWFEEDLDLGEEWLFGGQVFMDFLYKIKWFSIGLNGKYKITGDYSYADTDFSNYCYGVTVGINF